MLHSSKSAAKTVRVIEVGASHVLGGVFSRQVDGRLRLDAAAGRRFPAGAVGDAEITPALIEAIREVKAELPGTGPVRVVIPGHLALLKIVKVPATASARRDTLMGFAAQQNIPFPLAEVVWGYRVLADTGSEMEVLLAAAKIDALSALTDELIRVGFDIEAVVPAGLGLEQACRLDRAGQRATTLAVEIGARSTHLLFLDETKIHVRTIALAGNAITRSIADALEQTWAEAEQLKLLVFGGELKLPPESRAGDAVQRAAEGFVVRLHSEISRSIGLQRRQAEGKEPTQFWLMGGGAMVPGLAEQLSEKLHQPVTRFDPLAAIDVAAAAEPAVREMGRLGWAELVGAAAAAMAGGGGVDLVPPVIAEARLRRKQRPRWMMAAALLVGALALPGGHFQRLASARMAAAKELDRTMVPVLALQQSNGEQLARDERLQEQMVNLGAINQARHAWVGLLGDLQERLTAVQDVWLDRWQVLPPVEGPGRAARRPGAVKAADGAAETVVRLEPLRLRLSARLLDRANPLSRVSPSSYERATALLNGLVESPYVSAVEGERFDAGEPGVLRFDFTLVINPAKLR